MMSATFDPLVVTPVGHELLDDPEANAPAVVETLRNIARSNRWFGGAWAVAHGLRRLLAAPSSPVPRGTTLSLLDLGTGVGDLPLRAARWAAARGIRLVPVGIERNRVAAGLACAAGLPCAVACAGTPPIRDKSVDLVLLSQVVHHLERASAIRLLRTADRLARLGVLVADLRRGRLGPAAFWCSASAFGFDRHTRADGITSLHRGYTAGELRHLLAAAGVRARVERRPGFRLVATWRPAG